VFEKMMMDKTEAGEPRVTVFGGFEERPDQPDDFNPLQARFLKYLQFAVNNIKKGKIVRLTNAGQLPPGTVGIAPDKIQARPAQDAALGELIEDILGLLRQKEQAYPLPLVDLFKAIMGGDRTEQQTRRFGDRATRMGRTVIVDTIRDYAQRSGNQRLLHLL